MCISVCHTAGSSPLCFHSCLLSGNFPPLVSLSTPLLSSLYSHACTVTLSRFLPCSSAVALYLRLSRKPRWFKHSHTLLKWVLRKVALWEEGQNLNVSASKRIHSTMKWWIFQNFMRKLISPTHKKEDFSYASPSSLSSAIHVLRDIWLFISLLMQHGWHFVLLLAACCQHFFTASGRVPWYFFFILFVRSFVFGLKHVPMCEPRTQEALTRSAAHPQ